MSWGGRDYPIWKNGDIRIAWNCGAQKYTVTEKGKVIASGNRWDEVKAHIGGGAQSDYKTIER